jgi:hypothetical protein
MLAWLRKLFTPPIAPQYSGHEYAAYKIEKTVTLNGKRLDGKEADRVEELFNIHTNTINQHMDEISDSMNELFNELSKESTRE